MNRPKGYKKQKSCSDCKLCLHVYEGRFCNLDETFRGELVKWRVNREVEENGICPKHQK